MSIAVETGHQIVSEDIHYVRFKFYKYVNNQQR